MGIIQNDTFTDYPYRAVGFLRWIQVWYSIYVVAYGKARVHKRRNEEVDKMINFPSLETNVTYFCQNKCVACSHMIPIIDKPYHLDPAILERDLNVMKQFSHASEFSIIGGEPTLHPQIMDIIRIVQRSGIANTVLTYTNGQAMRHLPDDFYRELDRLVVDPYKIDAEECQFITDKCATFGLPLEWHETNFNRQIYRNKHAPELANDLYQHCWYRFNRAVVDEGYFYRCCAGPFIPKYVLGQAKEADGLSLEGITEQKVREYMDQKETPEMCYVCSSNRGVKIGWRETTRERWLEESLG
jgi:organic radical activating enzyme